jgi:hypothetical protein
VATTLTAALEGACHASKFDTLAVNGESFVPLGRIATMTIKADLKSMHATGMKARPGAHCSDGMHVDSGWHYHDMHQLLYAFEGGVEVESDRGRHFIPRQLAAWIPAGVPHRTSIHQVRSGSVFFPPSMLIDREQRVRTVLVSTLMRAMMKEAMR